MQEKIKDNSCRPLEVVEEKNEDQYLLEGIDIHDKDQARALEKTKKTQEANA